MGNRDSTPLIVAGVMIAFALLIAAIWASDAGTATSLALTGAIVLAGVGTVAMIIPGRRPHQADDVQRDRMKQTTP